MIIGDNSVPQYGIDAYTRNSTPGNNYTGPSPAPAPTPTPGQTGPLANNYAPPPITNSPANRPQTYAGAGNGVGINEAWAYDSTRYNDAYNRNYEQANYDQAMENYRMNELAKPGTGRLPTAPVYRNTDYATERDHVMATTPGFEGMGTDAGYDYSPYVNSPAGFRALNGGEHTSPQAAMTPQVQRPQMLQANNLYGGAQQPNSAFSQQGSMGGLAQMLALIAMLGGGGQGKQPTPFFNNNRSLFYPSTSQSDLATQAGNQAYQGAPQAQSQQGGMNPMLSLLVALLGGG